MDDGEKDNSGADPRRGHDGIARCPNDRGQQRKAPGVSAGTSAGRRSVDPGMKTPHDPTPFLLGLILLFSLGLKLLILLSEPGISRDGIAYVRLVQTWSGSGTIPLDPVWMERSWLPLYPFVMKILMSTGLSAETAGRAVSIVLGTFLPLIGFGMALEVTKKRKIALSAAFLLAVLPSLNHLSVEIQRDIIYLFLSGCSCWAMLAGMRRGKPYLWGLAGIFCAGAALTRYETAELLILFAAAAVYLGVSGRSSWKKCALCSGLLFISFAATFGILTECMGARETLYPKYVLYFSKKTYDARLQTEEQGISGEKGDGR